MAERAERRDVKGAEGRIKTIETMSIEYKRRKERNGTRLKRLINSSKRRMRRILGEQAKEQNRIDIDTEIGMIRYGYRWLHLCSKRCPPMAGNSPAL
jgi:hypothetical protein